jgi:hypothetical protein
MNINIWGPVNTWDFGAGESVNTLEYNSVNVEDIKYFDGTNLVDVELQVNGITVWKVE